MHSGCQLHLQGCWEASITHTRKTQTRNPACSFTFPALPVNAGQAGKQSSFRALQLSRKSILCTRRTPTPCQLTESDQPGEPQYSPDLQPPCYNPTNGASSHGHNRDGELLPLTVSCCCSSPPKNQASCHESPKSISTFSAFTMLKRNKGRKAQP